MSANLADGVEDAAGTLARNFSRCGLGRIAGSASCAFPISPRGSSVGGDGGSGLRGEPQCGGRGAAEGRAGVRGGGLGTWGAVWLCPRTGWRSRSRKRVWSRPQVTGSGEQCKGVRPRRGTRRVTGAAADFGGRVASPWGPGHKGQALGASCRTCRRGWGPRSPPAVAAHYGTRWGHCGQKEAELRPGAGARMRGGRLQWRGVGVCVWARLR